MNQNRLALLSLGLALALLGCGKSADKEEKGEIAGVVKSGGQPADGAIISFFPGSGPPTADTCKSDGSYKVSGVPVGTVKISVMPRIVIHIHGTPAPKTVSIDQKYGDPATSNLSYQVVAGPQTHNVNLD